MHRKLLKIQRSWRKCEKADGAVDWGVFLTVEVGFALLGIVTVGCLYMVMAIEKFVELLQYHDLEDEESQQEC